jgi:hypothetical protein
MKGLARDGGLAVIAGKIAYGRRRYCRKVEINNATMSSIALHIVIILICCMLKAHFIKLE